MPEHVPGGGGVEARRDPRQGERRQGGVAARRKILEGAPALRRRWQDESAKLEKDVAAQRDVVRDASVAKEAAEAEEKKATDAEDRLNKREASKSKGNDDARATTPPSPTQLSQTPFPRQPRPRRTPWTSTPSSRTTRFPSFRRSTTTTQLARVNGKSRRRNAVDESRSSGSTATASPPGRRPPGAAADAEPAATAAADAEPDLSPEERKRRDMDRLIAEAARNQALKESGGGVPAGAYGAVSDDVPDPEPATSMGEARGDVRGGEDGEADEDEEEEEEEEEEGSGGFFSSLFSKKSGKSGKAIRDRATRAKKAANDKRDAHAQAQRTLTELEGKHKDVAKRLSTFFGPNMELAHMVGECYKVNVEQYAYEVCPFGDAKQDTTRLGTMQPVDVNDPRTMVFNGGERCWNGPARSITVSLRCGGGGNRLADVEEPSRCEYAAKLYTPAACDPGEVDALERELAEMEEEARAAMGAPHDEL